MERSVLATSVQCKVTGNIGLVLNHHMSWYSNDILETYVAGNEVGHEIIAHQPRDKGSVWEEFRALGVEAWLSQRFCSYNTSDAVSNFQYVAYQITGVLRDYWQATMSNISQDTDIPQAPEVSKLYPERGSLYDLFTDSFALISQDNIDDSPLVDKWLEWIRPALLGWFVHGYWKADKVRYKNLDPYDVFLTRKAINNLGISPHSVGQKFRIFYNLETNTARYEEITKKGRP